MLPKFPLIKKKKEYFADADEFRWGLYTKVSMSILILYYLTSFFCSFVFIARGHMHLLEGERERRRKRKNHPLNGAWSSCNPFFLHFLISSELQSSMFMLPALFSRHQDQDLDYMGSSFLCTAFNHCYGANITPSLGIREAANSLWTPEK